MIIIAFDRHHLLGGLGDRIVGIISAKVIANVTEQKFFILWTKENIKKYLDYEKYDYELNKINTNSIRVYEFMNNRNIAKNFMENNKNLFEYEINKMYTNNEISEFLFSMPKYIHKNFYDIIFSEYKSLYNDILKPTKHLLKLVNKYTENKDNIVGIQIRAGDWTMKTNKNDYAGGHSYKRFKNKTDRDSIILNIFKKAKEYINDDDFIFITSDCDKVYELAKTLWKEENIIYNHDIPQHFDRKSIDNDISKIFIDNYILSQKTRLLVISEYSNFGRIAALSSNHDNIYDLDLKKIDKKDLIVKHPNL